jgi:D-alanyl-D-alanine carboxypeptidase
MFDKITLIYIAISAIIPILYLIRFVTYKTKKKKQYVRALAISFLMFFILLFLGFAFKLVYENTLNKDDKKDNKTTTTEVTTTKENTTKVTETTTTKKTTKASSYNYDKILTPTGGEVIGKTSKGYEIKNVDGIYYIDGYLVANKTYDLPETYNPGSLNATVKAAADKMFAAAKSEKGYNMWAQSGFRSYNTQKSIYNNYVNRDGKAAADRYSARPGYSEHQTGLAFDVCATNKPCITNGFDNTDEAKWLSENAYKYGFILRYVKGKENETGYMYESWHFRYVGTELAEKLYNNGDWISMETYFGFTSEYGANKA